MNANVDRRSNQNNNTKLLQRLQRPLKKLSLAGLTASPAQQPRTPSSGRARTASPHSPHAFGRQSGGGAERHHQQQQQQQQQHQFEVIGQERKCSAPVTYLDSGVYLGDVSRDPVLDMLNAKRHQAAEVNCRSASVDVVIDHHHAQSCPSTARLLEPFQSVEMLAPSLSDGDLLSGDGGDDDQDDDDRRPSSARRQLLSVDSQQRMHLSHPTLVTKYRSAECLNQQQQQHRHLPLPSHQQQQSEDSAKVKRRFLFQRPRSVSSRGDEQSSDRWLLPLRRSRSFTGRNDAQHSDASQQKRTDNAEHSGEQQRMRRKISEQAIVRFRLDDDQPEKKPGVAKKKRSLAEPFAKKFNLLRRRPTDTSLVSSASSSSSQQSNKPPTREDIKKWAVSFEDLLRHKHGLSLFRLFLQREFSEENIEFWIACEEYKQLKDAQLAAKAKQIFNDFVAVQASKEVNLDSVTRNNTASKLNNPTRRTFEQAQHRIESLMAKDSYPRFLRSDLYLDLVKK